MGRTSTGRRMPGGQTGAKRLAGSGVSWPIGSTYH
jgi:hypothetical protein